MRHKKFIFITLLVFIALLIIFVGTYVTSKQVLVVTDTNQNKKTYFELPDNNSFTLGYIHTIHLTPVTETFIVDVNNNLILKETRFDTFSVGMPYTDLGGNLSHEDGQIVIREINRTHTEIPIYLSPYPKHSLIVDGKNYPLVEFNKPGDIITIKVVRKLGLR
ncbi:MAG: hypothetical protein JM58_06415 [Peptococcaceae bacterium BICA1-8]|nr:MAG: hypothetical protein JM58_06415 [Peptococcaceae bacterium BICA1-8]